MTTFTAWITTDRSFLETDKIDVVVLANAEDGASTGDPLWSALTTIDYNSDDIDTTLAEARDLLRDGGWTPIGWWEDVPTGYIVNVEN